MLIAVIVLVIVISGKAGMKYYLIIAELYQYVYKVFSFLELFYIRWFTWLRAWGLLSPAMHRREIFF